MTVVPVVEWPGTRAAVQRDQARSISLAHWLIAIAGVDAAVALVAGTCGVLIRFGEPHDTVGRVPYAWLALILPVVWSSFLAVGGAYDRKFLGNGAEEFRRIGNTGGWLLGATAFTAFIFRAPLSRGFVAVVIPMVIVLTLLTRYVARRLLHRSLGNGAAIYRTVVVGTRREADDLVRHMERAPWAGFHVVGVCAYRDAAMYSPTELEDASVDVSALVTAVQEADADTIALAGSRALRNGEVRTLSWKLEGTGIQLVVAPDITDVAGPRIVVRPVQGLPLLHIEDPELTGSKRLFKAAIDRVGAIAGLIVLSPLVLGAAVAIKLTSRGPVIFKQERVGLRGEPFMMWKFRTMRAGAEDEQGQLVHLNEHDGVLFKIRNDPRVTTAGRRLRRHSIDELPQLWNVLRGQMSLVGPRPPLPAEVAQFGTDARRRLLVRPGMTGLWQVSGRAELPWEEAVRLDLHYVENWSVALDFMVLWKTLATVLHGRGAY